MVAVFTGTGLGLFDSSLTQIGPLAGGNAGLGQSRGSQYVNLATGNLILQDLDESMVVRGLNAAFLRTYNSRGQVAEIGQDGWITGFERRVELTGTLNAAGSTVVLSTGDGKRVVFAYTGTANQYRATAGDGAHDTLVWNSTSRIWTYTEGSTRREERYADHASATLRGRLVWIRDQRTDASTPAQFDVLYDANGRVSEVRSVEGATAAQRDAIVFTYNTAGQLASVSTRENNVVRAQVTYGYENADGSGRLSWVQTDLTPESASDNTWDGATASNNDGRLFRTSYTYVSTTVSDLRVASVSTSDGLRVAYTYESDGAGGWRVKTVTRGTAGEGSAQTTTLTYRVGATDVADAAGRVWTYEYDASGQLTGVLEPTVDGLRRKTSYSYDTSGNLIRVNQAAFAGGAAGLDIVYQYDTSGNRILQRDLQGNTVVWTYNTANQVTAETRYTGVDPDGLDPSHTGTAPPTGALVTRYIYDSRNRVRFVVDATGAVTELTYATTGNGIGQVASERRYFGAVYSGSYTETALNTWASDAAALRRASSGLTVHAYDAKGRLSSSVAYASVSADVNGTGVFDAAAELTYYTYDAQGLLRQKVSVRGPARTFGGTAPTTSEVVDYVYDGMGRMLTQLARSAGTAAMPDQRLDPTGYNTWLAANDATTLLTTYAYADSARQIRLTLDTGAVRSVSHDAAGRVVQTSDSHGATVRTARNYFDASGLLRASEDALGARSYFFYDNAGRMVATVDGTGALTETRYDGLGRSIETIAYSVRLNTAGWLVGGVVQPTDLATIRPGWSTDFSALPIAGLNTGHVNNPSFANIITQSGGRLAFDVNDSATATWPYVDRAAQYGLQQNIAYRAEVSTGADMSNTYLLFAVQNLGGGNAFRRAAAYFRNGTLYLNTSKDGASQNLAIGTLGANTTYVVEARTSDGRIQYNVYVKGQDPSTGWTFSADAEADDWGASKLVVYGYGGPGQNGQALYLDNLSEYDPGVRSAQRTYDSAGRVATETDAAGRVTTYAYDAAGRLLSTTMSRPGDAATTARTTRLFYDAADRALAALDAEGYLTESIYDAGGRLIRTIRYANATPASFRASGTLDQLRPTANAADQSTRYFYDARGRQTGMLDAEGYLSEYVYDEAQNLRSVKSYAKRLTGLSGSENLATLVSQATTGAPSEAFRLTQRSYNALGQVVTERNHEGTVTRYSYDEAGRLVKTEAAQGVSEVREGHRRYDAFGQLIGELSGEGSTHLLANMTEAQLDAIYAQYGVRHSYDLAGRRTESIDAAGNRVWYFYDELGRQTFLVRGMHDAGNVQNAQGEVVETRYDAFGQVVDTIAYTGRITLASPGSRASAQSAIAALRFDAANDTRVSARYDRRGQVAETIDAAGYRSVFSYTAFGELRSQQDLQANGSVLRTQTHTYDARGLRTLSTETGAGLSRSVSMAYDAFGRAVLSTDARGHAVTMTYDRLGRMVTQTANAASGPGETVAIAYDAYGRTVSQTDPLGRVTTYVHSDNARSLTMTSPEGVSVTTTRNRFGQVVTVAQTLPDGTVATTTTNYNRDGQVSSVVDALGQTAQSQYDARGLLLATVDASGRRVEFSYDAAGRVLTRREDPTGLNLITRLSYDGQGRQVMVTDASGVQTSMRYDARGQLLETVLDPNGLALRTTYTWDRDGRQLSVTQGAGTAAEMTVAYAYDAFGRRVSETVSPGSLNLVTAYVYDLNDNVVRRTDASGRAVRFSYDAVNRLRFSVDDAGSVSEMVYDAAGRVTMARRYAKPANIGGLAATPSEAEIAALVTAQSLSNDAQDEVVYSLYDRDGRLTMTVDGTGSTAEFFYDSAGRQVRQIRYAAVATLDATLRGQLRAGTAAVATVRAQIVQDAARDMQVRTVFDAAGRAVFALDATGATTRTWYDAAGRAVATRRYANTVSFAGVTDATTVAALQAMVSESAADLGEYRVYDAAGRAIYMLDLAGSLQSLSYDAAGRIVATRMYASAFATGTALRDAMRAGTATAADFAAFASANESAARAQATVYDSAGRARYSLVRSGTSLAQVAETRYDAAGRTIEQLRYGVEIPFSTTQTEAGMTGALSAVLSADAQIRATQIRSQRMVYDSAGRQRFMLDASGALAEWRYDGAGRVTDTLVYGQRPPAATTTETGLSAWANAQPAADVRRTRSAYDASGRLQVRTDALNKQEHYGYDGAGRMTSRIDRNGATWNYEYDAAGRRTAEISPQVSVGSLDANGNLVVADRRIATRFAYDALGNVVTRTDNADAPTATDRRTTRYVYDNRGYQIRTIFPDAGSYNPTTNTLEATGTQPTIEIVYNSLGQAVVQKDVRNHYSYKTYDAAGRLAYEVDQEGQATAYSYNAFGEVVQQRRYSNAVSTAPLSGWSQGQALSLTQMQTAGVLTASAADRTIVTAYTRLGQKASVTLPAVTYYRQDGTSASGSPVRNFAYNAYGDLVRESDLLQGTPGQADAVWADITRYYDALGRNTLTVDAEGYVTETQYNALGEAVQTVEYARRLGFLPDPATRPGLPATGDATIGQDRISRWTYDALGRKSTETSVREYRRIDGSTGVRDVVTSFGYDNEGRVVSVTDDTGTTTTTYDAIGRTLSVQEPARAVVVGALDTAIGVSTGRDLTAAELYEQRSPYTTMAYDAFGNAVAVRRYANGRNGASAAVADDSRDQIQLMRYDWQGRAVWERDGTGAVVTRRYDAADNITEVRYTLDGNEGRSAIVTVLNTYDRTGRQASTRTERQQLLNGSAQGAAVVDSGETVLYNAFGEIVSKTLHGLSGTLAYGYDNAGRMISSNETGAVRSLGYNLAGHLLRSSQKAYLNATDGTIDAVTLTRTDKLGRTLEVVLPSHTATSSQTSTVTQTVDRWGNVIRVIDARGYQTDYEYNSLNQLTREIRPLVKVVAENGAQTWERPVNHRYYDVLGRLIATRDANGNLRRNEYDAVGRMVAAYDAYGNATRHAYDALGNHRVTQNALGYLSFKEYDRAGRVVAIGDYLPSATATTRDKAYIQTYVLNQNGDRIQVANALGHAALYDYDSRQKLIRSKTSEGVTMDYAYDAAGRKARDSNALSPVSGTWTDRESEVVRINEATWDYDVFGRLIDHNNLSGRDSNYVYDAQSGQLVQETASGGSGILTGDGSRVLSYYANGRIRQIVEGATTYRYEYDAAGNRTVEEVTTADAYGLQVRTLTRTTYDSNNRVERVVQDDVLAGKRIFDLMTEYDANGNRRHVRASSGYGPNVNGIAVTNDAPTVVQPIADRTVRKGITAQFRLLFTDIFRDAEQDALSLTIDQNNGSALPAWLTVSRDPNTGEIVFTAAPGAGLADQDVVVRLTARETANATNVVSTTFVVRVRSNTAPTLIDPSTLALRVKTQQPWNMDLSAAAFFRDVDVGDVLSLAIENPASLPSWLQIDAGNPSVIRVSGTPTGSSTFTLRLRATDQLGASVVKQIQITTAPNGAPQVVTAPGATDAIINRQFVWSRPVAQVFADPEGDPMQITARLADGSALPSWMSFQYLNDQGTPELVFSGNVPSNEVDGRIYNVTLRATDSDGAVTTTTLSVRVFNNRAPVPTAGTLTMPSLRVNDDYSRTYSIASMFGDPENDGLSLAAVWPQGSTLPQWLRMTVDYAAGTVTFSGRPTSNAQAGTLSFQVRATDIDGLSSTKAFSISIGTDTAPARTGTALPDATLSIGRSFSYTIPSSAFTDADGDGFSLTAQKVVQRTHTYWEDTQPPTQIVENWVEYQPLPAWMSFNPATGVLSGSVPPGEPTGNFTVRIIATDTRGRSSVISDEFVGVAGNSADADIRFTLQPWVNSAPTYNTGTLPNRTLVHGGVVDFAMPGGAFSEPDGDTLGYSAQVLIGSTWTAISALGLSINTSTGRITGTASGLTQASYSARIIASDPQGLTAFGNFTIDVTNTPPTASTIPNQTAGRNQAFNFNVAGYFSDVNANPLSFTASGLPAGLSISSAGLISGSSTAALGNYSVTVTANDGRGGSVNTSFVITVANSAPTAPTIPDQTANPGAPWSYTVPAFTDPNNDPLSYSVSGLPAWMSFDNGSRVLSGTPGAPGSWAITVTATDTGGSTVSRTFTVTTPNVGPVYNVGSLTNQGASPGVGFSYTVPANAFSDANGTALTYSADANGSPLPSWLSFNPGTRTFSGTPSSAGTWTIRVIASDGVNTAVGTFSITTANVGPVYNNNLPTRVGGNGSAVNWTMPNGAFTDANGDTLTYTLEVLRPGYHETVWLAPGEPDWRWRPERWVAASAVNLSIAANGTITGTLTRLYSEGDEGAFQYYHDYQMRIIARDPSNATAIGQFAVSVNVPPTAPTVGTVTARQNSAFSYTLPAFSDANNNTLAYSVSNLPPGLSFNASTRAITGTPPTAGSWTVTYTADDGNGGVTGTTFTLTVQANDAPTAPSVGNQSGTINTALTVTLPAFSDPNFDPLTYSVSNLPPGLSFNPSTLTISGTPTTAGTWTVTYSANDSRGGVTNTSFNFIIGTAPPANRAPVVNVPLEDQWTMSGEWFVYTVPANSFVDPDNNPLTYSATLASGAALPSWLSFDPASRTFSGAPAGQFTQMWTIRVRVTDPSGLSVHDDFVLTKEGNSGNLRSIGGNLDGVDNAEAAGRSYDFDMGTGGPSSATTVNGTTASASDSLESVDASTMSLLATSVPVQVKDEWFLYDAENRLQLVGGQLIGAAGAQGTYIGLGASGTQSYLLTYDQAGQAVGRLVRFGTYEVMYRTTYDLRGRKLYEFHGEYLNQPGMETGGISKQYKYDAADRLIETRSYYQNGSEVASRLDGEGYPIGAPMSIAGWLSNAESFTYDRDGRMTYQVSYARAGTIAWRDPDYYNDSHQRTDLSVLAEDSRVMYSDAFGNSGYDSLGRVRTYRYTAKDLSWATHTYTSTYEGWGGYVEKQVQGISSNNNYRATTNTLTYDAWGKLTRQVDNTPLPSNYGTLHDRARAYTYDGDGRVLTRREGTIENNVFTQQADSTGARNNYQFVHAAGQQQAELKEGGQVRFSNGYTYNTQQIQGLNGSGNYAAGGGSVTVLQGETLQSLAQRIYGNSSLWYVLADANGLSDPDSPLIAGTQLSTPKVTVSNNDASTFKPYDPSEAIGPTAPGLPYITPPPKKSCNPIAIILMVVVAVVVTVFTAGALAAPAGATLGTIMSTGASVLTGAAVTAGTVGLGTAIGAAAVGGFMGSIASQVVGKALGVVDKISLRTAVASGLTAGLTAGIGATGVIGKIAESAGKFANVAKAAITAGVSSVTSYAANRIAGIDVSFSWKNVAAAMVTATVTSAISPAISKVFSSEFGREFAGNFVNGVVGGHVRKAFGVGGDVDYGSIALDAFGNALANAAVGALSKIGRAELEMNESDIQLRVVDQMIDNARDKTELNRLLDLRQKILDGETGLSVQIVDGLKTKDGSEVNALYDSNKSVIQIDSKLIHNASSNIGEDADAGLLGAYIEEVAEWAAEKANITYRNEDGRLLDKGAVNGMLMMQDLASRYSDVSFTLGASGGFVYRAESAELFRASVRLYSPDRILQNANADGVYFQKTSYQRAREAMIATIQGAFGYAANNAAMTVGLAFGIGEKGWDALRGLATLAEQAKGTLAYASLKAMGFHRFAEANFGDDYRGMMGLVDSVKSFVAADWRGKWDKASQMAFGGFFESLEKTIAAFGQLPKDGSMAMGKYFDFGRAAGGLVFEVVNIALTVVGAGAAAKAATALGRAVAARGGALISGGASRLKGFFDNLRGVRESDSVYHATTRKGAAQSIVDGIDPKYLNADSRFGAAFYVAEKPNTSLVELAHHGMEPVDGIRFTLNRRAMRVLDLTDPRVARSWGYRGGPITPSTQGIGTLARERGFNTIRYFSERDRGMVNYAVINDFNTVLRPQMITPARP